MSISSSPQNEPEHREPSLPPAPYSSGQSALERGTLDLGYSKVRRGARPRLIGDITSWLQACGRSSPCLLPGFPLPGGETLESMTPLHLPKGTSVARLFARKEADGTYRFAIECRGHKSEDATVVLYCAGRKLFTPTQCVRHKLKSAFQNSNYGVETIIEHGERLLKRPSSSLDPMTPLPDEKTLGRTKVKLSHKPTHITVSHIRLTEDSHVLSFHCRNTRKSPEQKWVDTFEVVGRDWRQVPSIGTLGTATLRDALNCARKNERRRIPALPDVIAQRWIDLSQNNRPAVKLLVDVPDGAAYAAATVTVLPNRSHRLDIRFTDAQEIYVGRDAHVVGPRAHEQVEVRTSHPARLRLMRGRILRAITGHLLERMYGPEVVHNQGFLLSQLTLEGRRPNFFVPGRLLAQAKWGPSAADVVKTGLWYVRAQAMCNLTDVPLRLIVFRDSQLREINSALDQARMSSARRPNGCEVVSLEQLMGEIAHPNEQRRRILATLQEAEDMADRRDVLGLQELRTDLPARFPVRRRRPPAQYELGARLVNERSWEERVGTLVLTQKDAVLRELARLGTHHSTLWPADVHLRQVCVFSFLLDAFHVSATKSVLTRAGWKTDEIAGARATILSIYPELGDKRVGRIWERIVAMFKLAEMRGELDQGESPDDETLRTETDGQLPSVNVFIFDNLLKRLERRTKRLASDLDDRLGVDGTVPVFDFFASQLKSDQRPVIRHVTVTDSDGDVAPKAERAAPIAPLPPSRASQILNYRFQERGAYANLLQFLELVESASPQQLAEFETIDQQKSRRSAIVSRMAANFGLYLLAQESLWERDRTLESQKGRSMEVADLIVVLVSLNMFYVTEQRKEISIDGRALKARIERVLIVLGLEVPSAMARFQKRKGE